MRRTRILGTLLCSGFVLLACEDGPTLNGPEQVLNTKPAGTAVRDNGLAPQDPWALDERRDFQVETTGDSAGRARFCDDSEAEVQVQDMIRAPILPDQGLGSLPLWGEDFQPLQADSLLGTPQQGRYCDPSGVYSNAFTFGPLGEIVVFFDEQTRLVESMYAQKGYLGAMEGKVERANGDAVDVWIRPGDPIRVGNKELKDDNPASEGHWLHPTNVNLVYRMLRKAYFPAAPAPEADYDCISSRICRILEVGAFRALRLEDSGVLMFFPPQGGAVDTIILQPVRVAPFEASAELTTGVAPLPAPVVAVVGEEAEGDAIGDRTDKAETSADFLPEFRSGVVDACSLALDGSVSWADFSSRCVQSPDTLSRASYSVASTRDTVMVEFNGLFLTFLRPAGAAPLKDGERPADQDTLASIAFTDNLNGPLAQWIPKSLGEQFKVRLEERVRSSLKEEDDSHPFASFSLGELPELGQEPTQLSPVVTTEGVDLVEDYISRVLSTFRSLTPAQKSITDPAIGEETFLIGSFVEAALAVLSGGATEVPGAEVRTIPSDDGLRITGRASFVLAGVNYRLLTSYNLVFGGMVYVILDRGLSGIDQPIDLANTLSGNPSPYYAHYLSLTELGLAPVNPFALGAGSIQVTGVDRQLGMLSVKVNMRDQRGEQETFELQVPGTHMDEGAGFMRQLEGETSEFVPSHSISFSGRETALSLSVDAEGMVRRVVQSTFKGPAFLCGVGEEPILQYGDNVRDKLEDFSKSNPDAFRACGIVYNYSPNKNVLDSVVSVINKVGIIVSGGRAVSAEAWQ